MSKTKKTVFKPSSAPLLSAQAEPGDFFFQNQPAELFLQTKILSFNRRLKELISFKKSSDLQKELFLAASYALFPGGKKLRPQIAIAAAATLGGDWQKALDPACALEMIHIYSLIHDDLPCMDNDDLRHGKPALHRAYPEWLALLTGDFLLTYAIEILAKARRLKDRQRLLLIQTLSSKAGGLGLLAGQYLDLASENKQISWETLKKMHLGKTGSLISAALEFGAIIAEVNEKKRRSLRSFGHKIGLAYQIVDDLIEISSPETILGKPPGSDLAKGKANALTVLGLKKAQATAEKLYRSALADLKKLGRPTALLELLAHKMVYRIF
ncbi:MAG: polyprenyl synthetase family protein [Parachlamydiales bacterium]|jgi:geranylgeranyl diphosphate synthase type II